MLKHDNAVMEAIKMLHCYVIIYIYIISFIAQQFTLFLFYLLTYFVLLYVILSHYVVILTFLVTEWILIFHEY